MESAQQIEHWIRNRQSTFVNGLKRGGQVPDELIEKLLDNASWAPSHGLVQAWEFKVFTREGLLSFYKGLQRIYKETVPAEKFNETRYQKFPEKADFVSHVIAIIMRRDPKRRFPRQEDLVSVAAATQNIYLSLQAYGLAGYLSTGDICYQSQTREFLGLDEEDECIGFFTIGVEDENYVRPPRTRIPAFEKTEWIRS
ncbi:MAG: nitroreductase [Bacteroidales bacterium]|nr:nitroreductase [Bacteroidales bacterium]